MKKNLLPILLLFTLSVTACGSAQSNPAQASTDLPTETILVVGTLKLEGTQQAVSGEQAKELLVMWQVYQSLSSSGTAAQAEINGLVKQVQGTMTSEQIKTISAMNLTQQDVFAVMQEQEGSMGQPRQSSSGSSSTQSNDGFAPPDGGMAGGAPPEGSMAGGAPPDGDILDMGGAGQSPNTDQSREAGANPGTGGSANVPTALVEALIQVLEQKAGS